MYVLKISFNDVKNRTVELNGILLHTLWQTQRIYRFRELELILHCMWLDLVTQTLMHD